jgi:hypothetical protein
MSNLVLSGLEFRDGYQRSGNWDVMLRNVKSMSDWLLKAHFAASDVPAENKFVGQVRLCARVWGGRGWGWGGECGSGAQGSKR